ncbi:hypothetical protein PR202_gb14175 [Eleusine coracana subsp. coracana]|uniref:Uncharacterized protein n=1 Tax=Eleusine coracana subsp. coracana TaxID=191504 RepID=A0AAV5EUI3_ELECO|nr:hypothetical protein PR202_gb14175 [Eleusine coracana subsp. coracana]
MMAALGEEAGREGAHGHCRASRFGEEAVTTSARVEVAPSVGDETAPPVGEELPPPAGVAMAPSAGELVERSCASTASLREEPSVGTRAGCRS